MGHHGPPRRTADYHALITFNAALGGQFTSRLNRNLRETRAITYGVRSAFDMRRVGGLFSVDASVQADATADAIAEILRECREMTTDAPIREDELSSAKASLTRGYARHFETAAHLVRAMVQLAAHDLDPDVFDQFVTKIEQLDADVVTDAGRRAVVAEEAAVIVVGDFDRLGPSLERLGREVAANSVEF